MPRVARIVIENVPHHITQRGNNHQDVFFTDDDRRTYLSILKEKSELYGVTILGYCLMTNHVHIVAVPRSADALARAIGRTNFLYTQYINRLHRRTGHLWQNRFYSCALDEPHLWRTMAYVERNPVRAKMVRAPWRYEWSSAAAHIGEKDQSELLDLKWWNREWKPQKWKDQLRTPADETNLRNIRSCLHTGRPLGTDHWIARLETKLNKRLRPKPVGRPKKAESKPVKSKRANK